LHQNYEVLMKRIEKQRDEAEEERVKEVIRHMNDDCENALKKLWSEAELFRNKCIDEMRNLLRLEIYEEMRLERENAIRLALEKAQVRFFYSHLLVS
jgi:hypothetical protein